MKKELSRRRGERGAVSTEIAILVAVLVGIAVFIGTAMVNKSTEAVNNIDSMDVSN